MSAISNEYYSKEELLSLANENNIPEKYYEDFILQVEEELQIMTDDGDLTRDEIKKSAIQFGIEYIMKFYEEIQKGHSSDWSRVYAKVFWMEEHQYALNSSYLSVKAISADQALEELKIHCKSVGGDELYVKHFINLMNEGEGLAEPAPEEQAATYSVIYKEQIAKGKSEIFAHQYADLMAMGIYSELGCFAEAAEYEKVINAGNSKKYAVAYSKRISEYIDNYYSNYDEALNDVLFLLEKEKIEKQFKHLK